MKKLFLLLSLLLMTIFYNSVLAAQSSENYLNCVADKISSFCAKDIIGYSCEKNPSYSPDQNNYYNCVKATPTKEAILKIIKDFDANTPIVFETGSGAVVLACLDPLTQNVRYLGYNQPEQYSFDNQVLSCPENNVTVNAPNANVAIGSPGAKQTQGDTYENNPSSNFANNATGAVINQSNQNITINFTLALELALLGSAITFTFFELQNQMKKRKNKT
ncbi:MAG: hypothetical protein Q7R70_02775 [Candidatus Diapherotrites archaeon]|nr:hypothetical protein [Candidatus Diapherotrites archaeon]